MSVEATYSVRVAITSQVTLKIECLGRRAQPAIWDYRGQPHDPAAEPLQLLEHTEYLYAVECPASDSFALHPRELFSPDDDTGRRGRVRTRERVGRVLVEVWCEGEVVGRCTLEVRSKKLDYVNHYRWMMRDIASYSSEALMSRFAASSQRFVVDPNTVARAKYQRIEFLYALLQDEEFVGALEFIARRPHQTWRSHAQHVDVRHHAHPGALARAISVPGARQQAPAHLLIPSLPVQMTRDVPLPTRDNTPNRFVRFALESWLAMVLDAHEHLRAERTLSNPVRRGLRMTCALEAQLDVWLRRAVPKEVSQLTEFPGDDQVLYKHHAYRKVWQVFLQTELASMLSWDDAHDRTAGVRDVATLYEYWVFFCFLKICERLSHKTLHRADLFEVKASGMHLSFKGGGEVRYHGECVASNQRKVGIKLFYNRSFSRAAEVSSWTYEYRPDISLEFTCEGESSGTLVHFDAKYKMLPKKVSASEAKQSDLNKMHVYHDAIMQSGGAFVVYPGEHASLERFDPQELLPGVGAYPLLPGEDAGEIASGVDALERFIHRIIEHIASPATRRERARYWQSQAYERPYGLNPKVPWHKPPADAVLLLGYVKSPEHLTWILDHKSYNLRADPDRQGSVGFDSATLRADTILLYGEALSTPHYCKVKSDAPRVLSAQMLEAQQYPSPRGRTYFVHTIEPMDTPELLDVQPAKLEAMLEHFADPLGAPAAISWSAWLTALGLT